MSRVRSSDLPCLNVSPIIESHLQEAGPAVMFSAGGNTRNELGQPRYSCPLEMTDSHGLPAQSLLFVYSLAVWVIAKKDFQRKGDEMKSGKGDQIT